jgi:predicted glycosyltransferase
MSSDPPSLRFLLYSHDALGLGHARRNLRIANAVVERAPESSVLVATSADAIESLGIPRNIDVLKLPGLRKLKNQTYVPRRLSTSQEQMIELREAVLAAATMSFRPHVMLVDKHPLGVDGELTSALRLLHLAGGRAVLGLRDVLDDPMNVSREWESEKSFQAMADHYDRILVYGSPAVFDPVREYGMPPSLAERLAYCGYVSPPPDVREPGSVTPNGHGRRLRVLVTVGGGEDGYRLLECGIRAAQRASWEATVVTGPHASAAQHQELRLLASRGGAEISLRRFVEDLPEHFEEIDVLVCMGGYNTLIEAVSRGMPTVTVPRIEPRSEQSIRAEAFQRLGLVHLMPPTRLDPEQLIRAVDDVKGLPRSDLLRRARAALELDGAKRSAAHLLGLATRAERRQRSRSDVLAI